jgi:hypothetical protein
MFAAACVYALPSLKLSGLHFPLTFGFQFIAIGQHAPKWPMLGMMKLQTTTTTTDNHIMARNPRLKAKGIRYTQMLSSTMNIA